eukprot:6481486-Amphidinium_carterae.1
MDHDMVLIAQIIRKRVTKRKGPYRRTRFWNQITPALRNSWVGWCLGPVSCSCGAASSAPRSYDGSSGMAQQSPPGFIDGQDTSHGNPCNVGRPMRQSAIERARRAVLSWRLQGCEPPEV